jgi:hypothetical protein
LSGGLAAYTYDDAQPLASLLASADAPEAFYISVKHGVEGVGDMLTKAISASLSQSAEYEQLSVVMSSTPWLSSIRTTIYFYKANSRQCFVRQSRQC